MYKTVVEMIILKQTKLTNTLTGVWKIRDLRNEKQRKTTHLSKLISSFFLFDAHARASSY